VAAAEEVDDGIRTTTDEHHPSKKAWLALSSHRARCHNHKFYIGLTSTTTATNITTSFFLWLAFRIHTNVIGTKIKEQ
jgi:hypothetical protein